MRTEPITTGATVFVNRLPGYVETGRVRGRTGYLGRLIRVRLGDGETVAMPASAVRLLAGPPVRLAAVDGVRIDG